MGKQTILFLAANPMETHRLALDREERAIREVLERSRDRGFELVSRWAAQPSDLLRELRALRPTVVHFSGHGGQDGLYFEGEDGSVKLASREAIAKAFATAGASVQLVVLNACFSEAQAQALLAHVGCVVGMVGRIRDDHARQFARGFYGGLAAGESVAVAIEHGRTEISLWNSSGGSSVPTARDLPAPGGDRSADGSGDGPQLRVRDRGDADQIVLAIAARLVEYCEALQRWLDEPLSLVREHTTKRFSEMYVPPRLHKVSREASTATADGSGEITADMLLSLVLTGGAFAVRSTSGSGKSVLVHWLALRVAQDALEALRAGRLPERIPVVVEARSWRDARVSEQALASFEVGKVIKAHDDVRQWLFEHPSRVALFIDGLDEIPYDLAGDATEAIGSVGPRHGSLIVTHRPQVTAPVETRGFELQPFNEAEQRELSRHLEATLTPTMFQSQPFFVTNPLHLTYLCLLPEPVRVSVRDATELLTAVTEHMMRDRKLENRQHTLRRFYEDLAWMHLTCSEVDGWEVERLRGDAGIQDAELLASGVLTIGNHKHPDLGTIEFLHKSFTEYFAAGHVVRMLKASSGSSSMRDVIRALGADGTSYLLGRLAKEPDALSRYAEMTFYDLTVQQYMYDIGALSAVLGPLTAVLEARELASRTEIVVRKLKAHALYGTGSASLPATIAALKELVAAVDRYDAANPGADEPTAWYRIWALDHLKNVDPTQPGLDGLLPEALQHGEPPVRGDERLVIRAAHYWGHLGNQEVRARVAGGLPPRTALASYIKAVAYRACAIQFSFDRHDRATKSSERDELRRRLQPVLAILRDAGIPAWVSSYVPDEAVLVDPRIERFPSLPQAVGDMANQLVWSGIVHCWNFIDSGDSANIELAHTQQRAATKLWSLATEIGTRKERKERIVYVLRVAELRTNIDLVDRPVASEAQLVNRLDLMLREVRKEFDAAGVVDERGMRDMQKQILAFFRALRQPVRPPGTTESRMTASGY
ncbi:MAG TPA: CHAT domain-containing protein [Kofleriaceae bacterium]